MLRWPPQERAPYCRRGQVNQSRRLIDRLAPMFLDPSVEPTVTNKTPGPGRDMLTASSNNLYSGVSLSHLETFSERYGLNSRLTAERRTAGRRGLQSWRPLRPRDPAYRRSSSRRSSLRHSGHG